MKLQAEVNGEKHEVEFARDGNDVVTTVDGRKYVVDASEPEKDVFLLKVENRVTAAIVSVSADNNYRVRVGADEIEVKIIDPKRLRGSAKDGTAGSDVSEIRTAMPGKVVRIIAPQGSEIKKGEPVVVVEAMKMQNEMKSPKDGVIAEIRFAEGDTVNAGDILAVIG